MMRANELRIGNYYDFSNSGQIEQITGKDIYEFESDPIDDIYYPIPLTEEWLLRFGFEYSDFYSNYKIKAGDYWNSMQFYEGEWNYNNDSSDAGCYYIRTIEHVHQLQNLYFALTGEELTLKK